MIVHLYVSYSEAIGPRKASKYFLILKLEKSQCKQLRNFNTLNTISIL